MPRELILTFFVDGLVLHVTGDKAWPITMALPATSDMSNDRAHEPCMPMMMKHNAHLDFAARGSAGQTASENIAFNGMCLDIEDRNYSGAPFFDPVALNYSAYSKTKVIRSIVDDAKSKEMNARVRIKAASRMLVNSVSSYDMSMGAEDDPQSPRVMARALGWSIQVTDVDALCITLTSADGKTSSCLDGLEKLLRDTSIDRIEATMCLDHVPELPMPDLKPGECVPHWSAYFPLFGIADGPVPKLRFDVSPVPGPAPCGRPLGGSNTCIPPIGEG